MGVFGVLKGSHDMKFYLVTFYDINTGDEQEFYIYSADINRAIAQLLREIPLIEISKPTEVLVEYLLDTIMVLQK